MQNPKKYGGGTKNNVGEKKENKQKKERQNKKNKNK